MGEACSTYGREERYLECISEDTWGTETTCNDQAQMGDNNKMNFPEMGCGGTDWIDLAQDRDR